MFWHIHLHNILILQIIFNVILVINITRQLSTNGHPRLHNKTHVEHLPMIMTCLQVLWCDQKTKCLTYFRSPILYTPPLI